MSRNAISVVDVWTLVPPPLGCGTDDDLLRARHSAGVVIIGDTNAPRRADSFGLTVLAHIGASHPSDPRVGRRARAMCERIGSATVRCETPWTAGQLRSGVARQGEAADAAVSASPLDPIEPVILPVASHPAAIDAFLLAQAVAVLSASGQNSLMTIPSGARQLDRSRRAMALADRPLPVEVSSLPWISLLPRASVVLDCGIVPGGPGDRFVTQSGVLRADARGARSPLAVATCIRQALRTRAAS